MVSPRKSKTNKAQSQIQPQPQDNGNGNGQAAPGSNGTAHDPVALADELLKDISGKSAAIKKTIQTLDAERARLEQDFNSRVKEIDKQRGRLNAFLVRLGGGNAVVDPEPKSNGESKRLNPKQTKDLEVRVVELASRHGKEGMRRSDVVDALSITGPQATRILSGLEQSSKLKAEGERAGRRYYVV